MIHTDESITVLAQPETSNELRRFFRGPFRYYGSRKALILPRVAKRRRCMLVRRWLRVSWGVI